MRGSDQVCLILVSKGYELPRPSLEGGGGGGEGGEGIRRMLGWVVRKSSDCFV